VITSADLTDAALSRNHELGLIIEDAAVIAGCHRYFDNLWSRGGDDLTREKLERFESDVGKLLSRGHRPAPPPNVPDEGVAIHNPERGGDAREFYDNPTEDYVKFFRRGRQPCPSNNGDFRRDRTVRFALGLFVSRALDSLSARRGNYVSWKVSCGPSRHRYPW
jgi:hypothetical protein